MILLAFIFLSGSLHGAVYGDDGPFDCDDTGTDCPTRMCFYSLDHEKRCYRAGCAGEELCRGSRNNECFATSTQHTCCCTQAGCAARYKGLNDCVDEVKNVTESVTSVTDAAAAETLNITSSTPMQTQGITEVTLPPSTTTSPHLDSVPTSQSSTMKPTITEQAGTTITTPSATTKQRTSSTRLPQPSTSQRASDVSAASASSSESTSHAPSSSNEQSTVTQSPTSSIAPSTASTSTLAPRTTRHFAPSTTRKMTTPTVSTSRTPSTTRSTTTTTATTTKSTTARKAISTTTATTTSPSANTKTVKKVTERLHVLHPLPDLVHSVGQVDKARTVRPAHAEATTTNARTSRPHPRAKALHYAEQRNEDSARSVYSRNNGNQNERKEESQGKSSGGGKKATSSLITVYEVTTSAVENRQTEKEWKAPVPWWLAVVFGFVVSVVVAWAVVFFLKKKKQREAEVSHKNGEKEQGLVDPLLKTSDLSEQESSRVSDNSRI